MKKNIYKNKKGFSLVETLIAVGILMIAIAGPLSLVQAGLFSSNHQRNQVTATYLAQEAFEFIKNLRDSNAYTYYANIENSNVLVNKWLYGGPGADSLLDVCGDNPGCYVDPHGKFTSGANPFIQYASSDKKLRQPKDNNTVFSYSYDNSSSFMDSPYKRTVFIEEIISDQAVQVTVKIEWKDGALDREYVVSENIYNYAQPDETS